MKYLMPLEMCSCNEGKHGDIKQMILEAFIAV